jgi:hypothetical protein
VITTGQASGDPLVEDKPLAIAGAGSGSQAASNVAVLVHKRTALGGRKGRGRLFIPWAVADSNVDEAGIIVPATVVTMQTAVTSFLNGIITEGMNMVLLHSPDKSGVTVPPTTVSSLVVDGMIATQRRRLGR